MPAQGSEPIRLQVIPYGERHGYAWSGTLYYDKAVPMCDLAALMGNDLRTHTKHYGQWTTDEDVKESVMRAVGILANATAVIKTADSY